MHTATSFCTQTFYITCNFSFNSSSPIRLFTLLIFTSRNKALKSSISSSFDFTQFLLYLLRLLSRLFHPWSHNSTVVHSRLEIRLNILPRNPFFLLYLLPSLLTPVSSYSYSTSSNSCTRIPSTHLTKFKLPLPLHLHLY